MHSFGSVSACKGLLCKNHHRRPIYLATLLHLGALPSCLPWLLLLLILMSLLKPCILVCGVPLFSLLFFKRCSVEKANRKKPRCAHYYKALEGGLNRVSPKAKIASTRSVYISLAMIMPDWLESTARPSSHVLRNLPNLWRGFCVAHYP